MELNKANDRVAAVRTGSAPPAILEVRDVTVRFGGIVALQGVTFDVETGWIVGLIGPNGAGKTTLFNCLSRLYIPSEGEILFEGKSILSMPVHVIAGLGIGRTFQNLALFNTMSVLDNIKVGQHSRTVSGFVQCALRVPSQRAEERRVEEEAWELVEFLRLQDVARIPVGTLPFGTRKRVEMARALASRPKLLLLDEPAAGLNHEEMDSLGHLIQTVRDRGITVLLVEHHMSLVMGISDKVVAIDFGKKIAEGAPAEVQSNEDVIRAYLGTAD